jgi:hypothetical protein
VIVLAHAGHVLVDLLYVAPLLVLGAALLVGRVRERRNRRNLDSAAVRPVRRRNRFEP